MIKKYKMMSTNKVLVSGQPCLSLKNDEWTLRYYPSPWTWSVWDIMVHDSNIRSTSELKRTKCNGHCWPGGLFVWHTMFPVYHVTQLEEGVMKMTRALVWVAEWKYLMCLSDCCYSPYCTTCLPNQPRHTAISPDTQLQEEYSTFIFYSCVSFDSF